MPTKLDRELDAITRALERIKKRTDALRAKTGQSTTYLMILRELDHASEPQSTNPVAHKTRIHWHIVRGALLELRKRGDVTETSRRPKRFRITAAGKQRLADARDTLP